MFYTNMDARLLLRKKPNATTIIQTESQNATMENCLDLDTMMSIVSYINSIQATVVKLCDFPWINIVRCFHCLVKWLDAKPGLLQVTMLSPTRSVIIRVTEQNRTTAQQESDLFITIILQTELDDTMSCYLLIIIIAISHKSKSFI